METNVLVFDTETTSVEKPFAYDLGYVIMNRNGEILLRKSFVIEQVWHNLPLFESAYYKEKRPTYVSEMRGKRTVMTKFGYAMSEMARDVRNYNVSAVYAFNSDFDDKVFSFCCDWFKVRNPIESIPVFDIWAYASNFISNTESYQDFCEANNRFTESGNFSGNAETLYQFLTHDPLFEEAHHGLADAEIEAAILYECIQRGAKWEHEYKCKRVLYRDLETPYTVKVNGNIVHEGLYIKKYVRNGLYCFTEKPTEEPQEREVSED